MKKKPRKNNIHFFNIDEKPKPNPNEFVKIIKRVVTIYFD
jgi:hypothetical protein